MNRALYFAVLTLLPSFCASSSPGRIVLNELMYAPFEPFGTTNETEFIELYNAGPVAVDLGAYRLDDGVEFEFAAGTIMRPDTYLVVCEDRYAFSNAYPQVTNVVGTYNGALNNGGEVVCLSRFESNAWVTVDTIRYIDGGAADGGGPSLELVHPGFARLDNHFSGAWSASTAPSGTPGVVNAVYDPDPPPVAGDVVHEPPLPFPGSIVTIRARVAGFLDDALPVVQLDYRKDSYPKEPWKRADMYDGGSHGDELAGDGVYAVQVPGPGDPAMQAGDLLEFRVTLQDANGQWRTVPEVNRAGVVDGPFSYLCAFGEDQEFTGEFPTYHILLTEENRTGPAGLESRGDGSDTLLDSTFITSGGRIIYNCGTRYRGNGSRRAPYSFRLEFPRGETWKGYQDINFLHNEPLLQHIGMRAVERSGGDNVAPETKLCRLWLNDTLKSDQVNDQGDGGVYVRMEKIGHDFIGKHYPDDTGNIYRGERTGDLDYRADLADYQDGSYRVETNNPFTIWHSLSNLCWIINQDASQLPASLAERVNIDQWARHYAVHVALENGEGGLMAARFTRGDDYYMYADPADGQFDLLPWDFDSILDDDLAEVGITRSIWDFESNDGDAGPIVSHFLLNPPMVSRYVGHIQDVLETTLDPDSMNEEFDDMGSALSPDYRTKLQEHMAIRRASILGSIHTQLTVSVTGAIHEGPQVSVVTNPSVSMSGSGPQGWTTRVLVGGEEAAWSTRTGQWATTNPVVLQDPWNDVVIAAFDHEGRLVDSVTHRVLVQTQVATHGGVIEDDTVWDASAGTHHVVSNLTLAASARLSLGPGAVVTMDPGVRLRVEDGTLDILGDDANPVHFYSADGSSPWSIEGETVSASITGRHASLHGGAVSVTGGAHLMLEDCAVMDYTGPEDIISAEHAAGVVLRRCRVADYRSVTFDQTPALVEACLFEFMSQSGIDIIHSTATVDRTSIRYSTSSWPVDGIRLLDGSTGTITGCLLHDLSGTGVAANPSIGGSSFSTSLVPAGSVWKYLDDGSDQGSAWTGSTFDDSAWSSGQALLGYGEGDERTVVDYGGDADNKYPTTYFRNTFHVADTWDVLSLDLGFLRDDGGIVYLNGAEVLRQNMPSGAVTHQTLASSFTSGADERAYFNGVLDGSLVVPGTNHLAVEIHQGSLSSVDLSFDMDVSADVFDRAGPGGSNCVVTVQDSLVHHCRAGFAGDPSTVFSNDHNTVTACETGIWGSRSLLPELRVRDSYLPELPVLVRVDMRDEMGEMGRDLWNATAVLETSDPEILMSTNRVELYNGRGSALVTFSGGGDFVLSATVDGKRTTRNLVSMESLAPAAVSGTLSGTETDWSGVVHVTGDLLIPPGHTLTIEPGTLVLLDGVASGTAGADIEIQGSIQCLGTVDRPVTFTAAHPDEAWGELSHINAAPSLYRHAVITRGGHAPGVAHTGSGPVVRLSQSVVVFEGSSISDLDGKVMYATSGSDVTFLDGHLARAVMGPEVEGTGLLMDETWITEMFGTNDNDGLYVHGQQEGQTVTLRHGVHAACDDDAIDMLRAEITVEDFIVRDAFDKGVSVYGGLATLDRMLCVDNGTGVSMKERDTGTGRVDLDHATLIGNDTGIQVRDKFGAPDVTLAFYVSNSILEPSGPDPVQTDYNPTNVHIRYTNVGESWPGEGNLHLDPQFVDSAARDLHLLAGSPCIDAGDPGYPHDADGSTTDMGYHPYVAGADRVPQHDNSIAWGNDHDAVGAAAFTWSIVGLEGTNRWPGAGNLNRNPWFRDPDDGDYRLLPHSPAVGTAEGGGNRGPSFPSGANPVAPSGLLATAAMVGDDHRVELSWQDNSTDELHFELERSPDGAAWDVVAVLEANTDHVVDTGLDQHTSYAYHLRAIHDRGESLYSETASVLTPMSTSLASLIASLRITEIMYNPADSPDDVHEFLELKNVGATPLDLSGVYFSDGIDFTFEEGTTLDPGAFLVLVSDPVSFSQRYPAQAWHGVFENGTGLKNSGETLTIADAEGHEVFSVSYDDGNDTAWYPTTDGDGYALVLNDPEADPDDASSWRASGQVGGSPGSDDPPPAYGSVVISEVLTHTDEPLEDAVELYNAGPSAVDISNWYLSDDGDDVKKYHLPAGTPPIPAGGRTVLYAGTSFGSDPEDPAYFALSEFGEHLYLSSAEGTTLTSYRTWVKFGAADNGTSFGRHIRSDGEADFVAMHERTFGVDHPASVAAFRTGTGLPNAPPRVGPVVINEIMYNPSATGKEFIELYNVSGASAPLFDLSFPANTWSLDGAVEYVFPADVWMASGEHVLLVGIDPDAFRVQFGLTNTALQVFGPYRGDLDNGGESVKLYKPGAPEPDGLVPRVRVDRVKYDDRAPWPVAADNAGPSLERIIPGAYGNDPTNWVACTVGGTPGAPNHGGCAPSVGFVRTGDSGPETNETIAIELVLYPPVSDTVTVHYVVGGTATAGADYSLYGGVAVFWPHDSRAVLHLALQDDLAPERDEQVVLSLVSVSPNARLGGNSTYTYTIMDTDHVAVPAPAIVPTGTNYFDGSILVTMTSSVPHARIFYTLDGSEPTDQAALYAEPFALPYSARVRARSYLGALSASASVDALFLEQLPLGPPQVSNYPGADPVGLTSADLNGTLVSTGQAPTSVSVYWDVADGEEVASNWTHVHHFGVQPPGPLRWPVEGLAADTTYYYRYHAANALGDQWAAPSMPFSTLSGRPAVENVCGTGGVATAYTTVLLSRGSTWNYLDDGSSPGSLWMDPGFNDGAWPSGPAKLGFGDNDEVTTLSFGPDADNKYTTTYFRRSFDVPSLAGHTGLTLRLLRDDGAVVYLNGLECARDNLPEGTISEDTFADSAVGGTDEDTFFEFTLGNNLLVPGTNTLAVELHQVNLTSSDLGFDLELVNHGVHAPSGGISEITPYSARVSGSLLSTGSAPSQVLLFWGQEDGGESTHAWNDVETLGLRNEGEVETVLDGLTPGATYFYRFAASNEYGLAMASCSASFTTLNHVNGVLHEDTVWPAASSPYIITGDLTVAAGATLTIEPGVEVLFDPGVGMTIRGRLLADGAQDQPITFSRSTPGSTWERLSFIEAEDSVLRHCTVEFSDCEGDHKDYYDDDCNPDTPAPSRTYFQAVVIIACHVDIEHCLFQHLPDSSGSGEGDAIAVISDDPDVPGEATSNIRHSRFLSIGQGIHTRHAYVLVEQCFFTDHHGDNDDIDLFGESIPPPLIRYNRMISPAYDDMINPTRCSAILVGNEIANCSDHGVVLRDRCQPVLINNLIYNCASAGIAVQNQCDAWLINNLIVNCNRAVRFFDHDTRWGPPYCLSPGSGRATLVNNVIWDCPTPLLLADSAYTADPGSHAVIRHSVVEGGEAATSVSGESTLLWGPGNTTDDPQFAGSGDGDYRLTSGSPCIDAGTNVTVSFMVTNHLGEIAGVSVEVTNDWDQRGRPLDGDGDGTSQFDIGPYEFMLPTADSNHDGVPDGWYADYGLDPADPDTGRENPDLDPADSFAEYLADTDPTNRWSYLSILGIEPVPLETRHDIRFGPSSSAREYTLQYTGDAVHGVWSDQAGSANRSGNGLSQDTFQGPVASGDVLYYRIKVRVPSPPQ